MFPRHESIGAFNRPNQTFTGDAIESDVQAQPTNRRRSDGLRPTSPPGVARRTRRRDFNRDHHRGPRGRRGGRRRGHHFVHLRPDQQDQLIERGEADPRVSRERGEATTAVLVVPIAMFLILVVVQAALVFHAQAIVDAAAQDGAYAGQGESGTDAAALSAVEAILGTSSGGLLRDVDVSLRTNSSRFTVTVQATVKSLIPGYAPRISSMAAGPREVFIPRNRR